MDGGWGAWAPAGKCSASCGEGLQLSARTCDQPTPRYGGQFCAGPSTKATACHAVCPVDGFWSGWSNWGGCSSSCIPQGQAPVRTRARSCANPAPSTSPPGKGCSGELSQAESCDRLPNCPGRPSPLTPGPGWLHPRVLAVLVSTVHNVHCVSTSQWTAAGAPGRPSLPAPSPVGWAFRCPTGNATAPSPSMGDVPVLESSGAQKSARPMSTVQVGDEGQ